jgi:hypothetical protein
MFLLLHLLRLQGGPASLSLRLVWFYVCSSMLLALDSCTNIFCCGAGLSPWPVDGAAQRPHVSSSVHARKGFSLKDPLLLNVAAAGVTGCPSGTAAVSPLLASAVSDPQPALSSLTNSTSSHFGMFGLHPVPSHLLQTAGSSIPHAVIEEQQQTAAAAAAAVSPVSAATAAVAGGSRGSTRRSSSCPGERGGPGYPVSDGTSSGGHHHRGSYSSSGGLQTAMLVPSGSSSARSSRDGSSSQGDREEGGEGDKRGKMGRWLRRVLHLEGPWRGAMPAGVFMGVV